MTVQTIEIALSEDSLQRIEQINRDAIKQELAIYEAKRNSVQKIYDTNRTCKKLGVSRPTLSRWRINELIEGSLIGGKYFYTEEAINNAVQLGLKYRR